MGTICLDDDSFHSLTLKANDIDVYHGCFTDDPDTSLIVDLGGIAYHKVDGEDLEINTVKCNHLSPHTFMANNDLNVTGACFHVNFAGGDDSKLFDIHVSPQLWTLLFSKRDERVIRAINRVGADVYDVTTCVRIAYKAWQMPSLRFDIEGIDFTKGTLANSQKAKFDKMKNWPDSPFKEYQCNKRGNHFVMVKKHARVYCVECKTGRANASCSNKMCKKCCSKHVHNGGGKCKVKDHINASQALLTVTGDAVTENHEESMEVDEEENMESMDME